MILTYRFVEDGGYDCMSDAFYIESPTQPDNPIARIDFCDFPKGTTREYIDAIVRQLVNGFNTCTKEGTLS